MIGRELTLPQKNWQWLNVSREWLTNHSHGHFNPVDIGGSGIEPVTHRDVHFQLSKQVMVVPIVVSGRPCLIAKGGSWYEHIFGGSV